MSFGGHKDATHRAHTEDCTHITIDAADKIHREKCGHMSHTTQSRVIHYYGYYRSRDAHVAHT